MFERHIVNLYNLLVVIVVAVGTLSTAYGLAIIGSTAGQPSFYSYFHLATAGEPGYSHTTNILGALNGVNSAGAFLGFALRGLSCLTSAWTADAFSRKRTIQLGCIILVVGGALNTGAVSIGMFIVGRLFAGAGSGILAVCVPMYQGEVSTAETRGAMMSITGIAYALGYSLAAWLGFACYFFPSDSPHATFAFRFPLAVQMLPPLIVLACSNFIPYSPRWLLSKDRREEAFAVVQRLHASPSDPDHIAAKQEFYLIEQQFEMDRSLKIRPFEIFRTKANRRRSMVATILMAGDQFIGIYVIANYGVLIYASLGLLKFRPLLLNACGNSLTIIGNTWTAFFIDRLGRRTFLLIGSTGCTLALTCMCALVAVYLGHTPTNTAGLNAAIFFLWLYVFFWCFFMDATQYVYVSEIWPNALRSQGTALGLSVLFLASEVTLVAAPVALNNIGWKFYLVMICPSVCYIIAIYFLFPETKGRTLEEIGSLFGDEHVASHWYGISEEEKAEIARKALKMTDSGRISEDRGEKVQLEYVEGLHGAEKADVSVSV